MGPGLSRLEPPGSQDRAGQGRDDECALHRDLVIVEPKLLAQPEHSGWDAPRGQHDVDAAGPQALDGCPGPGRHVAIRSEQGAVKVERQQARLAGGDHRAASATRPITVGPAAWASAQIRRSRPTDAWARWRPAAASK